MLRLNTSKEKWTETAGGETAQQIHTNILDTHTHYHTNIRSDTKTHTHLIYTEKTDST